MNDAGIEKGSAGRARRLGRIAVTGGRDLYRRTAAAVVRSGGDQTALALIAAGAAAGALSWLVLSRRRRTRG